MGASFCSATVHASGADAIVFLVVLVFLSVCGQSPRLASFRHAPFHSFANAANLNGDRIMHSDQMPSYFFAEILKYYYLLFSNAEPWPLSK